MEGRLLFIGLIFFSKLLFSQEEIKSKPPAFFMFTTGGGMSSFTGYSLYTSFALEKKGHLFTLRGNLNNQVGNKKKSFLSTYRYNDRLTDVSLLYGRRYRNSWLRLSASGGVGYYMFTDKYIAGYTPKFLGGVYDIGRKHKDGICLSAQAEALFFFDEYFGMSLCLFGNAGGSTPVWGGTLNMVFGILERY